MEKKELFANKSKINWQFHPLIKVQKLFRKEQHEAAREKIQTLKTEFYFGAAILIMQFFHKFVSFKSPVCFVQLNCIVRFVEWYKGLLLLCSPN